MTTNFLHYLGTDSPSAGSGFLKEPFELFNQTDAAFDTLANATGVTSANAGSSGKFNQTHYGQAQFGYIWLVVGDTGWTPTAGGTMSGWFVHSADAVSFEKTTPARAPDFYIPLSAIAYASGDILYATGGGPNGAVEIPWDTHKVHVVNNSGATMGNTSTTHAKLWVGPVAEQY